MLTRLIVSSYLWLLEVSLWLALIAAAAAGYTLAVPMLQDAGAILENEFAWKLCGALLLPVISFLALTVVIGPFLILVDMRRALRSIDAKLGQAENANASLLFERREPTL